MSRARNLPKAASRRIAGRRARLGTLAAPPTARRQIVARTRNRSRFGLLLLLASALFFTYVLWV